MLNYQARAFFLLFTGVFSCTSIACDVVVHPGGSIQGALSGHATTICLAPGIHTVTSGIIIPPGKTLKGQTANRDDAVINAMVSNATRVITVSSGTTLYNFTIRGASGHVPEYGLLIYNASNVSAWGLNISGSLINAGIVASSNIFFGDNVLSNPGIANNKIADPNLWISSSSDVDVWYGALIGRANGPGGDGELSCGQSNRIRVTGTNVVDSGASAIYFVNCVNSSIKNTYISNAGEWGLDIVNGSHYIIAENNYVHTARWGGMVYSKDNISGAIRNNQFVRNNTSGYRDYCNGINFSGAVSVTQTGNTVNSGLLNCYPWGY